MITPYGLEITESCLACKMRSADMFCGLSPDALQSLEAIKQAIAYPKGAVLFVEGQNPRGIFLLCKGRVKLALCSSTGKTLIMKFVEPGEVLGLSATISGKPYEVMAETAEPCQINFVRRDDFLRFLPHHTDAGLRVAEQLSSKYNSACRDIRALSLSHSSGERMAKVLLDLSQRDIEMGKAHKRFRLTVTHEEIGQMIGTSRETVTRLLGVWRKQRIVQNDGSILMIRDMAALKAIAAG